MQGLGEGVTAGGGLDRGSVICVWDTGHQEEQVTQFSGNWVKLESMSSEVSQTQKNKYHISPLSPTFFFFFVCVL